MSTKVPVLVVDDNPLNLSLMVAILSAHGCGVRTAQDAAAAQAAIEAAPPRLVLMDLQMPGVDGFELTRRLKADPATRGIVIIAVTALAMKGDEERARAAGCDEYLTKPVDKRRLRALIDRYM